jgi:hypothetical protein
VPSLVLGQVGLLLHQPLALRHDDVLRALVLAIPAGLGSDASPSEVHRRAALCLTAARSIGGGRVIRYSGTRR